MENNIKYFVFENGAAGQLWIDSVDENINENWTYQSIGGSHSSCIFESYNYDEVEKYYNNYLETSKKFVVIYNEETEYYYYVEMSANSGTYQENGIDFGCIAEEFDTEEEAQEYCSIRNNN